MNGGAAEGAAVAFNEVEAGREEFLLGVHGELSKRGGSGVGEGDPEADDGLKGLLFVYDDGRDMLVGLFEGLEGLGTAVGEQHGMHDVRGGRDRAGGGWT